MNYAPKFLPRRLVPVVTLLLLLAPAVNLVWRGGTGYGFFILLAIALQQAWVNRNDRDYFAPLRAHPWYVVAMVVPLIVMLVQQAVYGYWDPRQFDPLSRFALALPIFVMLCRLPSRNLAAIGWGCALGALAASAWLIIAPPAGDWSATVRLTNSYTNPIPFGDTALLFAFLSLITFGWDRQHRAFALVVKLLGLIAGGVASYLSGTRGGWIAIPLFLILIGVQHGWFTHWKRIVVAAVCIAACVAALLATERIHQRIIDATKDVSLLEHGDENTSIGQRLQLWRASITLFEQHPVYGVGKGHLRSAIRDLAQRGLASPEIINERAHSDFFSALAEMGAIGAASIFVVYFGTSVYFWRARRDADPVIRTAACSGLAVSLSTILFGLTIDVFVPIMVTVVLALLMATFLAAIVARRRECALDALRAQTQRDTAQARAHGHVQPDTRPPVASS
ncbi:O-antigen ligase family protein [Paraburkholderia adhaesiva]|uniref:O-antigen ligase family protein n=1 Tax=Paraburkholderia adhaesiva TaxID=2883244 RepID=UPI001F23B360|nr:O-antigen ligase family protein [Paraburkholderia adhaesiva]